MPIDIICKGHQCVLKYPDIEIYTLSITFFNFVCIKVYICMCAFLVWEGKGGRVGGEGVLS